MISLLRWDFDGTFAKSNALNLLETNIVELIKIQINFLKVKSTVILKQIAYGEFSDIRFDTNAKKQRTND